MKKIVTVIGARPQFIKMMLVSYALKEKRIKEIVVHTGQHYDKNMSDIFFKELQIPMPDYNLHVGSDSQGVQTARMLMKIEKIVLNEKPQIVLVYGDTNSTLAGALAASKLKIRIAHVEAGLRSFNMSMSEEINRIVTDSISSIFFCPTKISVDNLKQEGKSKDVYLVGDVMYDSIKKYATTLDMPQERGRYILCTIHRAENTNYAHNLRNIFKALGLLKYKIILPLHPRTAKFLKEHQIKVAYNIKIMKPVNYKQMLSLEKYAKMIIADSGGVQKEAFIFNVPCITLREKTEWVETVESGMNVTVGTSVDRILSAVNKVTKTRERINPEEFYGDGFAHKRIADILSKKLKA